MKHFKAALILASSILCLSMTTANHYDLLNDDDLEMQKAAQVGAPALSSAVNETPHWESFNAWQCFSTENIQPECSELDDGAIRVPTLRIHEGTILYDFSLDPEPGLNCEQTLSKWVALLESQRSLCIFAAHLQNYPDNPFQSEGVEQWQLWIVNQIKSYNGYWYSAEPNEESSMNSE